VSRDGRLAGPGVTECKLVSCLACGRMCSSLLGFGGEASCWTSAERLRRWEEEVNGPWKDNCAIDGTTVVPCRTLLLESLNFAFCCHRFMFKTAYGITSHGRIVNHRMNVHEGGTKKSSCCRTFLRLFHYHLFVVAFLTPRAEGSVNRIPKTITFCLLPFSSSFWMPLE
jgi:hypothetical protein